MSMRRRGLGSMGLVFMALSLPDRLVLAQSPGESAAAPSVVVDIGDDPPELTEVLETNFVAPHRRIQAALRKHSEEGKQLLEQLRKDPQNRRLAAAAETNFSQGLTALSNELIAIEEGQEQVQAAFERMQTKAIEARDSTRQGAATAAAQLETHQQRQQTLEAKARDVAGRLAPLLGEQDELPESISPELRRELLSLKRELETTTALIAMSQAKVARTAKDLIRADQLLTVVTNNQAAIAETYQSLRSQRTLVASAADLREQMLASARLAREISRDRKVCDEAQQIVASLSEIVPGFLPLSPPELDDSGEFVDTNHPAETQSLGRWLRDYSTPSTPPEELP